MSSEVPYTPTITDQLEELLLIAGEFLDYCLNDVELFRDNKQEFYKKANRSDTGFGVSYYLLFNNDKTDDDRYIIYLIDKIDEVLHKLYHIHLFIEINHESIEWTEEIERDWRNLDYVRRRDLLSCKFGLQRVLMNDSNIKNGGTKEGRHIEREINWYSSIGSEKEIFGKQPASEEQVQPENIQPLIEEDEIDTKIDEFPTRKGGRRKKAEGFDLRAEDVAKIFFVLSLAKAIPHNGNKTDLSSLYRCITGYNRDNARNTYMNQKEGIEKKTKEKIIERMKDALTRMEDWPEYIDPNK